MPFWKRKPKDPGPPSHGPDFSGINTRDKARAMVNEGKLELLYLMPPEFGGPDDPRNIVYVPVGIAEIKHNTDINIISPLIQSGDIQNYSAVPEYRGSSFVPMAIKIEAWDPQRFETEINIWGEALDRGSEIESSDHG